jgi:hypothetical protein
METMSDTKIRNARRTMASVLVRPNGTELWLCRARG